jgi:hypothetical protein
VSTPRRSAHLTYLADSARRCETSRERWGILAANFRDKTLLFDRLGLRRTFICVGVSPTLPDRVVWLYPAEGLYED